MFCETVMVEILSLEGCSYAIYQIRIMFSETVSDEIAKNLDDTLICIFFVTFVPISKPSATMISNFGPIWSKVKM